MRRKKMKLLLLSTVLQLLFGQYFAYRQRAAPEVGQQQRLSHAATGRALVSAQELKPFKAFNDKDLLVALISPDVQTILLSAPLITLNITFIDQLIALLKIPTPFLLTRNLTIEGDPVLPDLPVLDFNFYKALLKLGNGVALSMRRFIGINARSDNPARIPGADFLAPTDPGAMSYLIIYPPGLMVIPVCYATETMIKELGYFEGPEGAPPVRYDVTLPQDGCVNDPSAPYTKQCYGRLGNFNEAQVYSVDQNLQTGQLRRNNVLIILNNLTIACQALVTDDCIRQYESAYYCYLALLQQQENKSRSGGSNVGLPAGSTSPSLLVTGAPSDAASGGPASGGGGGSSSAATVGGVVGGCAGGLLLLGGAVALVVARRRRRLRDAEMSQLEDGSPGGDGKRPMGPDLSMGSISSPANMVPEGTASVLKPPPSPEQQPRPPATASSGFLDDSGDSVGAANGVAAGADVAAARAVSRARGVLPDAPVTSKVRPRPGIEVDIRLVDDTGMMGPAAAASARDDGQGPPGEREGDADSPLNTESLERGSQSTLSSGVAKSVQLLPVVRGKGGFGRVVEGMYDGQHVAVKMVGEVHNWEAPSTSLVRSFEQEVQVLGRCQHPNVVRLLAACIQPPRLCLVLELMEASLEKVMYGNPGCKGPMPMEKVLHIGIEVCRALAYLHPTIVHRDLKPGNVLVNDPWSDRPVVKLTDFGLSRLRDTVVPTEHPDQGTPSYMAPECFDVDNTIIVHKADIYSLGVLLWEMLAGQQPWANIPAVAIAVMITYRKRRLPLDSIPPERLPRKLERLLGECWDSDPARRPAAEEVGKELTLLLQQLKEQQRGEGQQETAVGQQQQQEQLPALEEQQQQQHGHEQLPAIMEQQQQEEQQQRQEQLE